MYFDQCRAACRPAAGRAIAEDEFQAQGHREEEAVKGPQVIEHRSRKVQTAHEQMIEVMDQLQSNCNLHILGIQWEI